jgi:hypothetical protein
MPFRFRVTLAALVTVLLSSPYETETDGALLARRSINPTLAFRVTLVVRMSMPICFRSVWASRATLVRPRCSHSRSLTSSSVLSGGVYLVVATTKQALELCSCCHHLVDRSSRKSRNMCTSVAQWDRLLFEL